MPDKTEGPVIEITFLGIVIDTDRMECRLLEDELVDLRQVVGRARLAKKLRLRKLQSLLGKLQFACRIIPHAFAHSSEGRSQHLVSFSGAV